MIVKFAERFIVPGFGRKRFPKGIVRDVPEALRAILPSSAEVKDDYKDETATRAEHEDRLAADLVRAQAEGTDAEALKVAGVSGYTDEESDKLVDEDALAEEIVKGKPARKTLKLG